MNLPNAGRALALATSLVLLQFGTASWRSAAEAAKSDHALAPLTDPVAQTPAAGTLPASLLSLAADTASFSRYALLVDKKARTLSVWQNDGDKIKLVESFPADIGAAEGDKVSAGDSKTPEGIYFFQTTMDGKKVDFTNYGVRIFTMDYPNYFDRLEHKTGNGIWLHAIPESKSLRRGSRGCVVVRNAVIEALVKYIELKRTPIVVVNQVEYLPEKDWLTAQTKWKAWLEDWRRSWSGKDLDKYMAWYSERFRSKGMNKAQWRNYKAALADRASAIGISLKDVQIFIQGPKIVMRFLQNYRSDLREDVGAKILYALKAGERYEIIGENWEPLAESAVTPAATAKASAPGL